ncbi:MAG: magnesium transporter [Candidatus Nealsonbacteria bacterium]
MKNNNKYTDNEIIDLLISSKKRLSIFKKISVNRQGFIFLSLPKQAQRKIINKLENQKILKMIRYLDLDKAVGLLRTIYEKERKEEIINALSNDIKTKVKFLLEFDPTTVAGLMNLNYIEVEKNLKIKDVFKIVQKYEEKTKKFPEILVIKDGFLLGELPGHSLFLNPNNKIENYIKKVPSIKYNKSKKEIIKLFKKNPHKQVVVLDRDKSILGIIYSDDIFNLINSELGKDLSVFAGVREEESVYDSAFRKVRNRYKWLIINLGTAFLAAFIVSLFEDTISALVLLAVYMPVVAGMGGNAGTQTMAVVVRGLALREIELKTARKVIFNEIFAGMINGLIIGVLVAGISSYFNKNPMFGLVVGLAMIVNLTIAGFFGTIIPLIMKKIGKDPASSASIFITTATDIFGFFVFLGLATFLLV